MSTPLESEEDAALLAAYVNTCSERAFAALVSRHVDLVYSACARQLRDPNDAQDACQAVFIILARRAASIRKPGSLGSWLIGVASFAARDLRQRKAAATVRERIAARLRPERVTPASDHPFSDFLDDALNALPHRDRAVLVLRYFEARSARDAAALLGISENAVALRASRAVRRLRDSLHRRGVSVEEAFLPSLLLSQGIQPASAVIKVLSTTVSFSPATMSLPDQIAKGTLMRMRITRAVAAGRVAVATALLLIIAGFVVGHALAQTQRSGGGSEPALAVPASAPATAMTGPADTPSEEQVLAQVVVLENGTAILRPRIESGLGSDATITIGSALEKYALTINPGKRIGPFRPLKIDAKSTINSSPWSFSATPYFLEGEAQTFRFSAGEAKEWTITVTLKTLPPHRRPS